MTHSRTFGWNLTLLFLTLVLFTGGSVRAQSFWQPDFGPKGVADAVIAFGPDNFIYVGSSGRGVNISSDDGLSWIKAQGISYDFISAIITTKSGTILAGTGGFGILRSTDTGNTWKYITIPGGTDANHIVSLKQLPDGTILAGTYISLVASADDGQTWVSKAPGIGAVPVADVVEVNGGSLLAEIYGKVSRSIDGGATWTTLTQPAKARNIRTIHKGLGNLIYLGCDSGLYLTTDAGNSWTDCSATLGRLPVNRITVDSSGDLFVALAPGGLRRSTDNGAVWTTIFDDTTGMYSTAIEVSQKGEIFYSADFVLYASSDRGDHWRQTEGFLPLQTEALAVAPSGTIYSGTFNEGIYTSADHGGHWANTGLLNAGVAGLTTDGFGVIYAAVHSYLGAAVSSDQGEHWSFGLMQPQFQQYFSIAVTPTREIYVSGLDVERSTDGGHTFILAPVRSTVGTLLADPAGRVYVGTSSGVLHTTGNGAPWQRDTAGLTISLVRALGESKKGTLIAAGTYGAQRSTDRGVTWQPGDFILNNINVLTLTSAKDGTLFLGSDSGVFQSADDGKSWEHFSEGMNPLYPVVHVMTVDSAGYIYASTEGGGIYRSGKPILAGVAEPKDQSSTGLSLLRIYPNPSREETMVSFSLSDREEVEVGLFDELGRKRVQVFNGIAGGGSHEVRVDLRRLSHGVYFCEVRAAKSSAVKMLRVGE